MDDGAAAAGCSPLPPSLRLCSLLTELRDREDLEAFQHLVLRLVVDELEGGEVAEVLGRELA